MPYVYVELKAKMVIVVVVVVRLRCFLAQYSRVLIGARIMLMSNEIAEVKLLYLSRRESSISGAPPKPGEVCEFGGKRELSSHTRSLLLCELCIFSLSYSQSHYVPWRTKAHRENGESSP
jgi:hypothetical protein